MADQKRNEFLEEQRKARQDFVNLKKMQQGEIETPPKPSEVAVVPTTFKEKVKNIWFHDKGYILGGLALVVLIAVMIVQCASRTEYDLEIVAYAYTPLSDNQLGKAAAYFEEHCEDISGDGEVHVQIINCSYNKENNVDPQYQYAMVTKLQGVLAADASALLFITDKDSYEHLQQMSEGIKVLEGEPVPLGESFYSAYGGEGLDTLPEGLQISCRTVTDVSISKDKKIKKYYEVSQKILKAISEK